MAYGRKRVYGGYRRKFTGYGRYRKTYKKPAYKKWTKRGGGRSYSGARRSSAARMFLNALMK